MGGHKDKRSSKSKGSKHKKSGKKERHSRKHKRSRRDSGASSSGDDAAGVNVYEELEMSRKAACAIREILAHDYSLGRDLREIISRLDAGSALDVSGIADAFVREQTDTLLSNIIQLRKNSAGQFYKRGGCGTQLRAFLAPLLNESRSSVEAWSAARPARAGRAPADAAGAVPQDAEPTPTLAAKRDLQHPSSSGSSSGRGPPVPRPSEGVPAAAICGPPERGNAAGESSGSEIDGSPPAPTGASHAMPDGRAPRRVLGPAMPPPEVLAAAAEMGAASESDREEEEAGDSVGPPPPELVGEADAASSDERAAEVARILGVLARTAADPAGLAGTAGAVAGGAGAAQEPDPYDVLVVDAGASASEIRRRYWRVSLLVHPDKCDVRGAERAFQAVATAAQHLQARR